MVAEQVKHDQVFLGLREHDAALPAEPSHRRRLAWYDDGYHMLLRDLEGPVVAADVASWALAPRAPLPSGADRAEATAGVLNSVSALVVTRGSPTARP